MQRIIIGLVLIFGCEEADMGQDAVETAEGVDVYEECRDYIDNDGNGLVDCEEVECQQYPHCVKWSDCMKNQVDFCKSVYPYPTREHFVECRQECHKDRVFDKTCEWLVEEDVLNGTCNSYNVQDCIMDPLYQMFVIDQCN